MATINVLNWKKEKVGSLDLQADTFEVEVKKEWFNGDLTHLDKLSRLITGQIRDEVLVKPIVKLVEPGSLPKPEGKVVRVKELRKALNS